MSEYKLKLIVLLVIYFSFHISITGNTAGTDKSVPKATLPNELIRAFQLKQKNPPQSKKILVAFRQSPNAQMYESTIEALIIECTALEGNFQEAIRLVEPYLRRFPNDPQVGRVLRIFLVPQEDGKAWQGAPGELRRIQKKYAGTEISAHALANLAMFYKMSGKYEEATQVIDEIQTLPGHEDWVKNLRQSITPPTKQAPTNLNTGSKKTLTLARYLLLLMLAVGIFLFILGTLRNKKKHR